MDQAQGFAVEQEGRFALWEDQLQGDVIGRIARDR